MVHLWLQPRNKCLFEDLYIGEMFLNVRPQQTVAPGDHHPVGGELEGAGRVEEEVGSLLEHQPEALHSPVLLGSKQSPSPPRLSM